MVQIVLSLEAEYDKKLRRMASEMYNNKKGAMSEIVEHGLDLFEKESKRNAAYLKLLALSKQNLKFGVKNFKREDAYE